jgi:hypothetical protein
MNAHELPIEHVIVMILFIVFVYTAIERFILKKRKN